VFSRREPADPTPWMRQLADDLRAPVFSVENASLGVIPGWCVVAAVAAFHVAIVVLLVRPHDDAGELCYGEVHV
jgi:uncharacterized membrane protein